MNMVKEVADAKARTGTASKVGRPRSNEPKTRAVLGAVLVQEAEELAAELEAELGFRPTVAQTLTLAVRAYRKAKS